MIRTNIPAPLVHLSFHETNILMVNIREFDHGGFISRLHILLENTTDPALIVELQRFIEKIQNLSPAGFEQLRRDITDNKVFFHPEYILPSF